MAKDPYRYFRIEARELLEQFSTGALDLEQGMISPELMARMLRIAHTLKGAARVVKEIEMADLAHRMEEVLGPHRAGLAAVPREEAARLLEFVDACQAKLQALAAPGSADSPAPAGPPALAGAPAAADRPATVALSPTTDPARPPSLASPAFAPRDAEDQFTSVRVEIVELDTLLYDLAEMGVHLGAYAKEMATVEQALRQTEELLEHLSPAQGALASAGAGGMGRGAAPSPHELELRALSESIRASLRECQRSFRARLARSERDFGALRERANELRLLPARTVFPFLERATRDAAEALHKSVRFEAEGGEHRLDAHVLLAMRDALLHVVRNAVAHGIEAEGQRVAAGKPAAGRVSLRVQKRGQQIAFIVADDGRGLDLTAIGQSAVRQGLMTAPEAAAVDLAAASRILLHGGTSTATSVSSVAGRGVGLDVVRSTVQRLKGTVRLDSQPAIGTTLEILAPISLELQQVVAVVAYDAWVHIPFNAVLRILRLKEGELVRSPQGWSFAWGDQAIPFQTLDTLLGGSRVRNLAGRRWTAVVVERGGQRAAVGVDRTAGLRDVLVRPLPMLTGSIPLVSGAVMDEAGQPQLVLDPAVLIATVVGGLGPVVSAAPRPPQPILVVDDSLTTRMLEQSILESAGYQVDLAVSGEEALEKARQKEYAMFVVDVEMPGINGYELLERFRADRKLRDVPAILVTSLASPDDRRRGAEAGARAYIVKSEFHEGRLLQTIRGLIEERAP